MREKTMWQLRLEIRFMSSGWILTVLHFWKEQLLTFNWIPSVFFEIIYILMSFKMAATIFAEY